MRLFFHFGRYFALMAKALAKPEKKRIYLKQLIIELENIGINSVGIVVLISIFIGAVITIQLAYNFENPLIPKYLIGLSARDIMMLEFSSTMVGLILAGKVGSNIASEIGTMRITEQIDAMEMMGVNSAGYLILPKVIAAVIFNPFLTIISIFVGIAGGWMVSVFTNAVTQHDYLYGIHAYFCPFYISQALIKTVVFAIIITSVPAYHGYYVRGGALEVGKASTRAVVYSSILILLFNLILTQLLLGK
ncbi:MAG: ABC transporter permease [Bacteroidia bacterium]|nr:ABC transporter permease [Bacteroidia bacterium]